MSYNNNNNQKPSIYDSLPMLDSWYQKQPIMSPSVHHHFPSAATATCVASDRASNSPTQQRRARRRNNHAVQFSVDPPMVHYVRHSTRADVHDEDEDQDNGDSSRAARINSVKSIMKSLLFKHTRRIIA
ncbi:hypothetical protein BDB00DRAFT_942673 [Zychaea mexicana]|uniref:uncharacterized protein n=1 Tax=Zychaea mexicana TaxID=64656 RepID=UPI0022FDFAAD|nr:uncharacterized protein BDB00DRAFT_942673 [Zychaea mexicana]KAI9485139.1 hypothetical protein BDB00DRAFT_942673 [Zychaea mexicana]